MPHLVAFKFTTRWGYGGRILGLNPRRPHGGHLWKGRFRSEQREKLTAIATEDLFIPTLNAEGSNKRLTENAVLGYLRAKKHKYRVMFETQKSGNRIGYVIVLRRISD